MPEAVYRRVMFGSAIYDLLFTIPFATPWGFELIVSALRALDEWLGLPGVIGPTDPLHALLANLMASTVLVWAILRLRLRLTEFGRYDAAIRALFALWICVAMFNGVSLVLCGLLLLEIVLVVLQLMPIRQTMVRPAGTAG